MEHDVRIEHQVGHPLAVVRRRASGSELSRVVPEACGTVWGVLRSQGVTGAGRHVAVYLDDQINVEVGVEMEAPFPGHGDVVRSATPSGMVAALTIYGELRSISATIDSVPPLRWLDSLGRA